MTGDDDRDGHGRGDDHHAFAEGRLSPEQELDIARRALAEGNLHHAAHHVAAALAIDPNSSAVLAVAGQLLAAAPDPLALTAVDGEPHYGLVALRALTMRRLGEIDEAVSLLLAVIGTCPEVPFTTWLETWLADGAADQLDPGDAHLAVEDALRRLEATDYPAVPLPTLLELIARVRDRHPDHERLAGSHARALRRAGQPEDAVAVARAADERAPTYFTGVILASSLRDAGDLPAALAVFRDLAARFPEETAVHLDMGDLLLDLDQPAAAAAEYQLVLDGEVQHAWAAPSALYARYLETGEGAWRDRLEDLAESRISGRARQLADAVTPYLGYLPGRPEALIQLAAQVMESDTSGDVEVSLSSLEAPSAARVLEAIVRERGGSLQLTAEIPIPIRGSRGDRSPSRCGATTARSPSQRCRHRRASIAAPIAELAASPYHAAIWIEHAQIVGRELGVDAVEGLLGAMLHAPPMPDGWWPWDWMVHVQVAAAMALAFVDEGWDESARQAALTSLVYGPVDWTAAAGLVALTRLACVDPERGPDIEPILEGAASHPSTPNPITCA